MQTIPNSDKKLQDLRTLRALLSSPDLMQELHGYYETKGDQMYKTDRLIDKLALKKAHEQGLATLLDFITAKTAGM